jgi:hypothetical protein
MGNTGKSDIQGEGDYEAARRYRRDAEEFVEKADIDKAAQDAAPKSPDEHREMDQAERIGRSRSRGGKEHDMDLTPEPKKTRQ